IPGHSARIFPCEEKERWLLPSAQKHTSEQEWIPLRCGISGNGINPLTRGLRSKTFSAPREQKPADFPSARKDTSAREMTDRTNMIFTNTTQAPTRGRRKRISRSREGIPA